MFYALFKLDKLIGIFDSKDNVQNMINGIVQNKFCSESKLSIRKYATNTIYEVTDNITTEDKNKVSKVIEKEPIIELTAEEEEKRNKRK